MAELPANLEVSRVETSPPRADASASDLIWSERYRLAALSRQEWLGAFWGAVIVVFLFVLFHYLGNTVEDVNSRSAFHWMVARWSDKVSFGGADYSHGWLIPLVSLFVVWYRRKEILDAPRSVCNWGLAVIVVALLMHWVGAKMQQTRLSLAALILLLWGFPLYFFGWQVARRLIFAVSYLVFAIPLNFLDVVSFRLRYFSSAVATNLINALGVAVRRDGVRLYAESGFNFEVADPCSGLRSLLAMTALTAVYAYFTQRSFWKKWALFICSMPLAVAGNIARIVTVGLVAEAFGERVATGIYHDWSGYIVFTVAILLMVGVGSLLNLDYRTFWRRWKAQWMAAPHAA